MVLGYCSPAVSLVVGGHGHLASQTYGSRYIYHCCTLHHSYVVLNVLQVPENEVVCVEDAVYGRVEIKSSTIEDQVLLKTDGFPTYHFACVVDDHCMEISHVLRGEVCMR